MLRTVEVRKVRASPISRYRLRVGPYRRELPCLCPSTYQCRWMNAKDINRVMSLGTWTDRDTASESCLNLEPVSKQKDCIKGPLVRSTVYAIPENGRYSINLWGMLLSDQ